jgi:hypothetical protein
VRTQNVRTVPIAPMCQLIDLKQTYCRFAKR